MKTLHQVLIKIFPLVLAVAFPTLALTAMDTAQAQRIPTPPFNFERFEGEVIEPTLLDLKNSQFDFATIQQGFKTLLEITADPNHPIMNDLPSYKVWDLGKLLEIHPQTSQDELNFFGAFYDRLLQHHARRLPSNPSGSDKKYWIWAFALNSDMYIGHMINALKPIEFK